MNVEPLVLDITSDNSIKSAVDIVQAKFGHLDVLINNAAILLGRPEDSIRQRLTTVFDTNVFGTIAVTEAFIPLLRNSTKVKRIVFVSSGLGSLAIRADLSLQAKDYIEYGSSKAALNHAALTLATRHRENDSWKFNICCPGHCATSMTGYNAPNEAALGAVRAVQLATLGPDGVNATFSSRNGPLPW
ncbi:short-chain dehydrogenase [Colletotrichum tofieldiae]|nr:short-chain dehydrogenase [Colletotrichum tofieldiae]GKT68689.1 short-chain dehydrogenase [Colletotrichum tofieldiae]